MILEHFFGFVAELLFGLAKNSPDKMPEDITYKPAFVVRYSKKKTIAKIVATLIIIVVFSLLWVIFKDETRYLFIVFVVLGFALFVLSLISFSFRCSVTEILLKSSYWGLFNKQFPWSNVRCVRVVEKTEEKSVIIAVYDESGKCVIDLNTDMENAWYVVKMAEEKSIIIHYEKDLSLKQISHL